MGIGVSVFLLAIGAILKFAVNVQTNGFNLDTIGVILMIAGAVGLLMFVFVFGRRDRVGHSPVCVTVGGRDAECDDHVATVSSARVPHRDPVYGDRMELAEVGLHDSARVLTPGAGFDGVVHFAAKSLVAESAAHPELYWQNNVAGSLALLLAMRDAGVERLVFSSTCATYGAPDAMPITESTPTSPASPYGASKLAVDTMIAGFWRLMSRAISTPSVPGI